MTRATKNIVSAYQRDRVFVTTLYANESRELVTEFSGVLPPVAVTYPIVKATWDTWDTTFAPMSEPEIDGTRVKIRIKAQYSGRTRIRVDATAADGNVYSAWHVIRVESAPYFSNGNFLTGPSHLEAVVQEVVTTVVVDNSILDTGQIEKFFPTPAGFVVGDPFSITVGVDTVEFTYAGSGIYNASGTEVSGEGTLTQFASSWPVQVTYQYS